MSLISKVICKERVMIGRFMTERSSAYLKTSLFIFLGLTAPFILNAQTTSYKQFSPEFQLNRAISDRWAVEFNFNTTFSDTPSESKVTNTKIQGAALVWAHYFFSPRWKFSANLSYYNNNDQPEIEQVQSHEWRLAVQSIYYLNRKGFTLSTRMRPEIRFVTDEDGTFQTTYRYRQMLKYIQPVNRPVLRQGTWYAVASEEVLFRSSAKSSGIHHFDRNMFVVGAGMMINDDLQVELTYTNEFAPRDDGNILSNLTSFTLTTNNLFTNIHRKIKKVLTRPEVTD
jgi:hypothetical protein